MYERGDILFEVYREHLKTLNKKLIREGILLPIDLDVDRDHIVEQVVIMDQFLFFNDVMKVCGSSYRVDKLLGFEETSVDAWMREKLFKEYEKEWKERLDSLTKQPENAGNPDLDVILLSRGNIKSFNDSLNLKKIEPEDKQEPVSDYLKQFNIGSSLYPGVTFEDDDDEEDSDDEVYDDYDSDDEDSEDESVDESNEEFEDESDDYDSEDEDSEDESDEWDEDFEDFDEDNSDEDESDESDSEDESDEDYEEEDLDDEEYEDLDEDYETLDESNSDDEDSDDDWDEDFEDLDSDEDEDEEEYETVGDDSDEDESEDSYDDIDSDFTDDSEEDEYEDLEDETGEYEDLEDEESEDDSVYEDFDSDDEYKDEYASFDDEDFDDFEDFDTSEPINSDEKRKTAPDISKRSSTDRPVVNSNVNPTKRHEDEVADKLVEGVNKGLNALFNKFNNR